LKEERNKENQQIKTQQKQQVNRITEELKKERLLEREARRRALLDIKEDKEKRRREAQSQKSVLPPPSPSAIAGPSQSASKEASREEHAFIQVSRAR
jgi:hypothetical protein